MQTFRWLSLVAAGLLLCLFGLRMALFFYAFPAVPGFLEVTFWGDTVASGILALVGAGVAGVGAACSVRAARR